MTRRLRVMLAVVGSAAACTSLRSVEPGQPPAPRSRVRVQFESPRDLQARHDTTIYVLPAVETLYGRLESTRSDTLLLRVLQIESRRRQPDVPSEAEVTVAPAPGIEISTVEPSPRKTNWLIGGVAVIAAIAVFLSQLEWEAPAY